MEIHKWIIVCSVDCIMYRLIAHPRLSHQETHCHSKNQPPFRFQQPSADYSQPHVDNFGNFLRRIASHWPIYMYLPLCLPLLARGLEEGPNPATAKNMVFFLLFCSFGLLGCDRGAEVPQGWTPVEVCRVILLLPRGPGAHRSAIFFLFY